MISSGASRKRKRISKNKKKGWRITDIADVEEHLEDRRNQELTGGIVADKLDEELFFVDTAIEDAKDVPSKKKRTSKPLRCHALLEPDPHIKPARVKHNVKQNLLKKRSTAVQEKLNNGILNATEKMALEHRLTARQRHEERKKKAEQLPTATKDLWGNDKNTDEIAVHYLNTTKQRRIPRPAHHSSKPSELPAVPAPHPGMSYNPAFGDHQALLGKALIVEEEKERQEEKIKRALDDYFPKGANAPKQIEANWIKEMSHGLGDSEEEGVDEDEEDDLEDLEQLTVNPAVRREDKKTEMQRKKEKERKQAEKEAAALKVMKKKQNEIFRLKGIKKEIRAKEELVKQRQKKRDAKKQSDKTRTKRLGSLKYQEPDLELKLGHELRGSLRELKPEGHLLEDRLSSLQKRNIIEPRKRAKRELKYKRKYYVRKSHRNVS